MPSPYPTLPAAPSQSPPCYPAQPPPSKPGLGRMLSEGRGCCRSPGLSSSSCPISSAAGVGQGPLSLAFSPGGLPTGRTGAGARNGGAAAVFPGGKGRVLGRCGAVSLPPRGRWRRPARSWLGASSTCAETSGWTWARRS